MWGKEKIYNFLEDLMKKVPFEKKELVLEISSSELTRFANNIIHQNVSEENLTLFVRVGEGKKKAVASISKIDEESINNLISTLKLLIQNQPEMEELILPKPQVYQKVENRLFTPSPEKRANIVKNIIRKGELKGLNTYGAISEVISELSIMNSNGLFAYGTLSYAHGKTMYISENSSGYQESTGKDLDSIDFEYLSEMALKKCLDSKNPEDLEPGKYDVVLEPLAVAEIMEQLSYFGFSAKAVQEKRSFLSLYQGQRIFSPLIHIYDDGLDEKGIIIPFDFEGVSKKHVDLVKEGVPLSPVYDTATAIKDNRESTGHALPPTDSSFGPLPSNLFLVSGDKKLEDLISSTERGILVTRFHYVNAFLDPIKVLATGMTRDGTFLIENGRILKPLKNLRFTQSFVEALGNVEAISSESILLPFFAGFCSVPGLKIKEFNFTGVTEF
ncbi:MAG: TldD/PmbA family protein [Dictyoglomaceae bacterium]